MPAALRTCCCSFAVMRQDRPWVRSQVQGMRRLLLSFPSLLREQRAAATAADGSEEEDEASDLDAGFVMRQVCYIAGKATDALAPCAALHRRLASRRTLVQRSHAMPPG